jgi:hypothetical protein
VFVPSSTTSATWKRCRTFSESGSTSRPQTSADHQGAQAGPEDRSELAAQVGAGGDLVGVAEQQDQVSAEVQQVPQLVGQLRPGRPHRDQADHHEDAGGDGRADHRREGGDDRPGLRDDAGVGGLRVAEDDEDDMGQNRGHQRRAQPAVPAQQVARADPFLEPGDPAHHQQLDEEQIAAGQAGDPAGREQHRRR